MELPDRHWCVQCVCARVCVQACHHSDQFQQRRQHKEAVINQQTPSYRANLAAAAHPEKLLLLEIP